MNIHGNQVQKLNIKSNKFKQNMHMQMYKNWAFVIPTTIQIKHSIEQKNVMD